VTTPGRDELLERLETSTTELRQLLACSDLDRPVPSCPGWTVTDLAHHLGNVHAWAEAASRSDEVPPIDDGGPTGRDELVAFYGARAGSLVQRLRTADPDEPCWHFGPKPRTVGWWLRRQCHETAVHLWDAQAAVGTPAAIDPAFAADGVDEVLDVFVARQVRLGRIPPLPSSVRLVATDVPLDRLLGEGDPVATVSGPAADLYLLLWKRRPLEGLDVDGDPRPVLESGLVP
jgi:uncharacterized protein (TIGR03083 family)